MFITQERLLIIFHFYKVFSITACLIIVNLFLITCVQQEHHPVSSWTLSASPSSASASFPWCDCLHAWPPWKSYYIILPWDLPLFISIPHCDGNCGQNSPLFFYFILFIIATHMSYHRVCSLVIGTLPLY